MTTQKKTPQYFIVIWLIILLFLFAWKIAVGQLPEINQRMLYYADSVEGLKIRKGLCGHFVMEAVSYAIEEKFHNSWWRKYNPDPALLFSWEGYNLPREYALPGDIVYFSNHVGIVYAFLEKPCCIKIAHQNGTEGSPVTIEDYCLLNRLQIRFIRVLRLDHRKTSSYPHLEH